MRVILAILVFFIVTIVNSAPVTNTQNTPPPNMCPWYAKQFKNFFQFLNKKNFSMLARWQAEQDRLAAEAVAEAPPPPAPINLLTPPAILPPPPVYVNFYPLPLLN